MQAPYERRRLVRRLLARHEISNQEELVELLASAGHSATQATVSRDLQAVRAVKERGPSGRLRYVIPDQPPPTHEDQAALARLLVEFVDQVQASGPLVVVRSRPGAAHVVAAAIDAARLDGVLGTVAGDDTLLVVAAESVGGRRLAEDLEQLGGRP